MQLAIQDQLLDKNPQMEDILVMFQNAPANPHIFLEKSVPPPWRVDTETDP